MKYGLIALLVVFLGIGEYAFVEFYHAQPYQRIQKFEKLPIVRSFVKAATIRDIEKLLEDSDSGFVSLEHQGVLYRWDNASVLYSEFKDRVAPAQRKVWQVKDISRFRRAIEKRPDIWSEILNKAKNGDFFATQQLYRRAQFLGDDEAKQEAVDMLREQDSASAKWFLGRWINKTLDPYSREGLLIHAQMNIEDFTYPNQSDESIARDSKARKDANAALFRAAENGDEDAKWVVEQLAID